MFQREKSEGRRYSPAFCASKVHDAADYMMIRLLTINRGIEGPRLQISNLNFVDATPYELH
jgi:hypothetical protein